MDNVVKEECSTKLVMIVIILNVGNALANRSSKMWKNLNVRWGIAGKSSIFI